VTSSRMTLPGEQWPSRPPVQVPGDGQAPESGRLSKRVRSWVSSLAGATRTRGTLSISRWLPSHRREERGRLSLPTSWRPGQGRRGGDPSRRGVENAEAMALYEAQGLRPHRRPAWLLSRHGEDALVMGRRPQAASPERGMLRHSPGPRGLNPVASCIESSCDDSAAAVLSPEGRCSRR